MRPPTTNTETKEVNQDQEGTSSAPFLILALRGHTTFLKSMSGTYKLISILTRMSMKLHDELGSFCGSRPRFKRLHAVRAVDGATHSQNDSVEANAGGSSDVLTKGAFLFIGGLELAFRPGIFAILDFYEMDVPPTRYELTRVPDHGQWLVGWCCC